VTAKHKILVADDDREAQELWRETLASWGYEVAFVEDGEKALTLVEQQPPHVLLCDLRIPRKNGLDLLRTMKERGLNVATFMLSGVGRIDDAVQAIKLGAHDYLIKPVDLDRLHLLLKNVSSAVRLNESNQRLQHRQAEAGSKGRFIIGQSPAMRRLTMLVDQVAPTSASILISGETGTGKEIVARAIHDISSRREGPFIALNCAAIPETLIESELFGHERGAFTGADKRRAGCFELAQGGTLFLDEIGEMKSGLQTKLLRVLEDHKIRRVGGADEIKLDVRVLAASNRDLETAARNEQSRKDLYYRLGALTIKLPPLRERINDIPLFVDHFLAEFEVTSNKAVLGVEKDCMEALQAHAWPGNVRELRNIIQRAMIVTRGPLISLADLPPKFGIHPRSNPSFEVRPGISRRQFATEFAQRTLAFANGNKAEAERLLNLTLKTVHNSRNSGKEVIGYDRSDLKSSRSTII
jgi:two-component system response regulator HydG